MKVLQLKNAVDGFATIDFSSIDMDLVLKTGDLSLVAGKSFQWNKDSGQAISDCPFFIGAMPIFDTEKLGSALNNTQAKTATFEVEGKSFTIVAAPQFKGQIINLMKSDCRTFRSGKIMTVNKYVFNKNIQYPDIFTPSEFVMFTFCNTEIAQRLLACRFNQLEFTECPTE
ncbi:MAG: hypothetical protein HDS64_08735 [Bacteroidales bacterium]|nr:hypothetical protein [Bacteroidales bacterium]